MFARRWLLPVRECTARGESGARLPNWAALSKRGERGEDGRIDGEERGEGIFVLKRGERTGESPLEGAVLVIFCASLQKDGVVAGFQQVWKSNDLFWSWQ